MKQFKIRSSQTGKIVGNPRAKKDKELGLLSQTAKSFCKLWLKEQIYNRKKEFSNKYTQKGIIGEDDSIDLTAKFLKYGMLLKNEDNFEDNFKTGTPDVILPKLIIDVKSSWDFDTFPLLQKDIPNMDYYWQAQSYMSLVNRDNYKLIYVLIDTPKHLITKEAYYYAKDNGYEDLTDEIYQMFYKKMTYLDIPNKYKIKVYDISRNNEDIKKIEQKVIACREYIKELKNELQN